MHTLQNIVILAAGDGTRFWPLTGKVLFSFAGKSLLEIQLKRLSGVAENIFVVVNQSMKQAVEEVVGKSGVKATVVIQEKLDEGQAGAIRAVKGLVKGGTLIMNANDVFDTAALKQLVTKANEGFEFVFLAQEVSSYFPGGYVQHTNGKVTAIIEKPTPENVPSNIVKLVADYFTDVEKLIATLESIKTQTDDWYEQSLTKLMGEVEATFVTYSGQWGTLKYPWHVLILMEQLLSELKEHRGANVTISPSAKIEGQVVLGDNVKVGDFAKIVGPCYIGRGTIVADYALVRNSMIGNDCLIGGLSEVARSYLGDKVYLHRDYVGDSVFAAEVLMGADAVTANFRFDQKNVLSVVNGKKVDSGRTKLGAIVGAGAKIGVHCTILPGVKIGTKTFIGPQTLVNEDIEDEMYLFDGEKKKNSKA